MGWGNGVFFAIGARQRLRGCARRFTAGAPGICLIMATLAARLNLLPGSHRPGMYDRNQAHA
jgi:hypothetical protein